MQLWTPAEVLGCGIGLSSPASACCKSPHPPERCTITPALGVRAVDSAIGNCAPFETLYSRILSRLRLWFRSEKLLSSRCDFFGLSTQGARFSFSILHQKPSITANNWCVLMGFGTCPITAFIVQVDYFPVLLRV